VDSLVRGNRREKKRKAEMSVAGETKAMEAGLAQMKVAPTTVAPALPPAPRQPCHRTEAPVPEVVMADVDGEYEIEDFSDMESVQR
jgi:hypothetical protein